MNYDEKIKQLLKTPRVYWTNLEKENTVDGLIDLCRKYITGDDVGVEVGCFSGVSSSVISLHCKELYCVDPWSWDAVKQAEKMFDNVLKEHTNINKVKMESVKAANTYDDNFFDFIYIDADHTYDAVVSDIKAWKNKIKDGGYIAGHDSYMPEVIQAVRDCLGEPLEIFSDTSWIYKL